MLQPEVYIPKWLNVSMAKAGGKRQSNTTTTTKNKKVQTDVAVDDGNIIDDDLGSGSASTSGIEGADPNKGIPNSGLTQAPLLLAVARYHVYKIR